MGYPSDGGLATIGQGNWYPLPVPEIPKPVHKPVIRDELDDPSSSSKKGEPKPLFIQGGYITSQVVSSVKGMMWLKFDKIINLGVEGHYAKKQKVLDTATDTMLVSTPLAQNLQDSPKTPLVSGSRVGLGRGDAIGIGNPQNAIITTSYIGGHKYNVASSLSPSSIILYQQTQIFNLIIL